MSDYEVCSGGCNPNWQLLFRKSICFNCYNERAEMSYIESLRNKESQAPSIPTAAIVERNGGGERVPIGPRGTGNLPPSHSERERTRTHKIFTCLGDASCWCHR